MKNTSRTTTTGAKKVAVEAGSPSSPISTLGTSGDRLTPQTGHPWEFWFVRLLPAAPAGAFVTWLGGRLRRRHEEATAEEPSREDELVGAP